jgi:hypothetical protein
MTVRFPKGSNEFAASIAGSLKSFGKGVEVHITPLRRLRLFSADSGCKLLQYSTVSLRFVPKGAIYISSIRSKYPTQFKPFLVFPPTRLTTPP